MRVKPSCAYRVHLIDDFGPPGTVRAVTETSGAPLLNRHLDLMNSLDKRTCHSELVIKSRWPLNRVENINICQRNTRLAGTLSFDPLVI